MTMSSTPSRVDPQLGLLYGRVLAGDAGAAQAWFDQQVLDRYRARPGWRVMRTNSVGRLRSPDGWSLDFGIAEGDHVVHASLADLSQRLPPAERQHWTQHLLGQPVSRTFLTMRLAPGSCIDDGELRDFDAQTQA